MRKVGRAAYVRLDMGHQCCQVLWAWEPWFQSLIRFALTVVYVPVHASYFPHRLTFTDYNILLPLGHEGYKNGRDSYGKEQKIGWIVWSWNLSTYWVLWKHWTFWVGSDLSYRFPVKFRYALYERYFSFLWGDVPIISLMTLPLETGKELSNFRKYRFGIEKFVGRVLKTFKTREARANVTSKHLLSQLWASIIHGWRIGGAGGPLKVLYHPNRLWKNRNTKMGWELWNCTVLIRTQTREIRQKEHGNYWRA